MATPATAPETNGNGVPRPKTRADWIPAEKVIPFKVSDTPYTRPGPGQVVVKDTYLALERGRFVPAPPPLVVGKGREKIQEALDIQLKGVSGKKLVVTL
ncbi:hypothetical protein BDW66DRAFT_149241 [Aspergillus desertorum]